jgi:hypothetical protein
MPRIVHGHNRRLPGGGRSISPEYRAWVAMKNRCLNPNQGRFRDYGERGIGICERWIKGDDGLTGFQCFLRDVGVKPAPGMSLDRIDNDQGYRPGNVRWATGIEQARNTRANRVVDIGMGPMPLALAIERYGAANGATVRMRIHRGWPEDDAILTPVGTQPTQPAEFPET